MLYLDRLLSHENSSDKVSHTNNMTRCYTGWFDGQYCSVFKVVNKDKE